MKTRKMNGGGEKVPKRSKSAEGCWGIDKTRKYEISLNGEREQLDSIKDMWVTVRPIQISPSIWADLSTGVLLWRWMVVIGWKVRWSSRDYLQVVKVLDVRSNLVFSISDRSLSESKREFRLRVRRQSESYATPVMFWEDLRVGLSAESGGISDSSHLSDGTRHRPVCCNKWFSFLTILSHFPLTIWKGGGRLKIHRLEREAHFLQCVVHLASATSVEGNGRTETTVSIESFTTVQ